MTELKEVAIDKALSLKNVDFTLKGPSHEIKILSDISLDASANESIAITGPSGSGKSSLIMLIAGLDSPSGGSIIVANEDIVKMNEDARARFRSRHIGIVFQSFHLIPTMTALENCALPLEFLGARDAHARAKVMLEQVGLADRLHHYPSQMSGGEQQRVGLARAIIAQPDILLADEPTGNLDKKNSNSIADLLFSIQKQNNSCLILVTHDEALARRCDRVLVMDNGRLTT